MSTDRDFEIPDDSLTRSRYPSFAISLPEPLSYRSDGHTFTYLGMFCLGNLLAPSQLHPVPPGHYRDVANYMWAPGDYRLTMVDRGPINTADALEFVWIGELENGLNFAENLTCIFRGERAEPDKRRTINTLIAAMQGRTNSNVTDGTPDHVADICSISLLNALYLTAKEPDLTPQPQVALAQQRRLHDVDVLDLGLRVGSALREHRGRRPGEGLGGWTLPPHIRAAHFERYRIATRDENGAIIGRRDGVEGIDWHYEKIWKAPTPVNVGSDDLVSPVARKVGQQTRPAEGLT